MPWLCAASCALQLQRFTCQGKQWELVILDVTPAVGYFVSWLCAVHTCTLYHKAYTDQGKGKQ